MEIYDYTYAIRIRRDLKQSAKTMLYDLVDLWDKQKHKEGFNGWIRTTDSQLESWGKHTFANARKELIGKGLIIYKRGAAGVPSRYRLLLEKVKPTMGE